jgi:hypothetical protein
MHADARAARGDANVYAASLVVLMFMAFGQMQPHSSRHGSKKWCGGEVPAGARAAEIAQRHHEKGQTLSVGEGLTSIRGISAIYY